MLLSIFLSGIGVKNIAFITQDIVGKMRFLLNLTPASHFHAAEEILLDFDDHSKKRKRTQNTPSLRMSQEESPLKTWKDLFNAWQVIVNIGFVLSF